MFQVPVELLQLKQRQDQLLQLLDRLNNELSELSSNPCNTKDEFMVRCSDCECLQRVSLLLALD